MSNPLKLFAFTGIFLLSLTVQSDDTTDQGSSKALNERIEESSLVAQVKILHITDLINRAMTFDGALAVQGQSYQVSSVRDWKREDSTEGSLTREQTLELRIDLQDCYRRLDVGKEYLVFAHHNEGREFQSYSCLDAIAIGAAQELVAELNQAFGLQIVSN